MADSMFTELKRRNVFKVGIAYLVLAWVVIQVADTAVPALHLPEWIMTAVFLFGALGFPFAIFFAWAFEITPDGIKKETDITPEGSITAHTSRKLDFIIIALLVTALGYFIWKSQLDNSPVVSNLPTIQNTLDTMPANLDDIINPTSIAVLAFSDLSQAGDQEYFSDGMAEEIINVLVRIDALKVTSRTSAFQFKGTNKGIPEIAKQLKVRYVLEGSVRKSGNTLRITAQLIDANNDKHLWSDTFDRPLTTENIFAIQGEISNAILEALDEQLNLPSKIVVAQSTSNLTAYELYLKAKPLFLLRHDLDIADQLLEQATNLDPKFAKAWEIRAALQTLMVSYNYSDMTIEETSKRLFEFANKAIELEPNSSIAIASKALLMTDKMFKTEEVIDVSQVLADYNTALKIDPKNASAHNWKGLLIQSAGFLEKALASFQSCLIQEPYYSPCSENKEIVLAELGRDEEAINFYLSSLNRGNRKVGSSTALAAMSRLNMEILFKTSTNHEVLLQGWPKHEELYQAFKNPNNDHSKLVEEISELLKNNERSVAQDADIMLNPLGRIPQENTLGMWDAINHQGRQTLEFKQFIKRIGIYDFWIKSGFPPQCRALPDSKLENDFECD